MGHLAVPLLMHELRMGLVVLGQTVHLRGNHRGKQPDALGVEFQSLARGLHRLRTERVPVEHHEMILVIPVIMLNEGILRDVIE